MLLAIMDLPCPKYTKWAKLAKMFMLARAKCIQQNKICAPIKAKLNIPQLTLAKLAPSGRHHSAP